MALVYQIFSNGGSGGPVDYAAPIATVSGTSYTTAPLSPSGDYRFAVRTMDTATGLVELNTQAIARIVLDAAGDDVGARPNEPIALVARPTAGGGCLAAWAYLPAGQAAAPTSFSVFLTAGASPSLTSPAATVAYQPGVSGYTCQLAGLADGTSYTLAVVAQGAGPAGSAAATTIVGDATPPEGVDALAAVAVP